MKNCQNREHNTENCKKNERCGTCGIYTCSPNFAYHVCIASLKSRNLKRKWENNYFSQTCEKCNYKWTPRKEKPRQCPNCKRQIKYA